MTRAAQKQAFVHVLQLSVQKSVIVGVRQFVVQIQPSNWIDATYLGFLQQLW